MRVEAFGITIADSMRALRVVETAGAPCYYVAPEDCRTDLLVKSDEWTLCEWKGIAFAYDLVAGERTSPGAAWSYSNPLTDLGCGYDSS